MEPTCDLGVFEALLVGHAEGTFQLARRRDVLVVAAVDQPNTEPHLHLLSVLGDH